MAPDERNFERALARHLRSESAQPSACADAETLAAYHERLLAPHELSSWKQHIAGCARCQEILAQLEATEEIPVASVRENEAHVVPVPALPAVVATVAASAKPAGQPVSIQSASPSSAKPRRPAWRLLVPAGALAAGLLVWIASRDRMQHNILQPTSPTPVSSVASSSPAGAAGGVQADKENAESLRAPKTKADSPRLATVEPKLESRVAANERSSALRSDEASRDQARSYDLRKEAPALDRSRSTNAVGPSNRALQQQANNAYQVVPAPAPELNREPQPQLSDKLAAAAPAPAKPGPHAAPAPPPPASAGYVGAPVEEVGALAKKRARQETDAKALVEPQTVVVTGEAAMFAASMSIVGGQRVLPAPGGKIIWRIEPDGRVRRTTDAGGSWKDQDTGVTATLFSGSAPSEKVCWLVGTFGTVLLTTDGGVHWTKVTPPINLTIDRIEATDARHAVITLQSSSVQFETFDSGGTWSLVKRK